MVTDFRSIPHHPGNARLDDNLSAGVNDPLLLDFAFGFVFARQRHCTPVGFVAIVGVSENDTGIAAVSNVDLAVADERNAGRGAGSAGHSGTGFRPIGCEFGKNDRL